MDSPQIDSTLVKMILTSIKEGDLTAIKNKLAQYNIDLRLLKDSQTEQNAFFFAALIKADTEEVNL